KIYRKRRDVRLLQPLHLSIAPRAADARSFLVDARSAPAETRLLNVYDQLLDRYLPRSFLVNDERQLVDTFNGAERLLHLGKRRPSTNVLDLLEGELRAVVAGAIQRVLTQGGPVRYTGVPVVDGNTVTPCILSAEAFTNPRTHSANVLICVENES